MKVRFGTSLRNFSYDESEYYETVVEERKDWIKEALCLTLGVDPSIFYSDIPEDRIEAKRFCFACPVRQQCAEFAIVTREDFGIWGGLEFKVRRIIKRRWRNGTRDLLRKLIETYGPTTPRRVSKKTTPKP